MLGETVFIDSNIWLYALIENEDEPKHAKARDIIKAVSSPVVSSQVITEVCVNLLKKANQAEAFVQELIKSFYSKYDVISLDDVHFLHASKLRSKYSFSYWDSIIVSAALESSCGLLYTEDMQEDLVVDGTLKIKNPLV